MALRSSNELTTEKAKRTLQLMLRSKVRIEERFGGKSMIDILDFGYGNADRTLGIATFAEEIFGKVRIVGVDNEGEESDEIYQQSNRCQITLLEKLRVTCPEDLEDIRKRSGLRNFDIITFFNPWPPPNPPLRMDLNNLAHIWVIKPMMEIIPSILSENGIMIISVGDPLIPAVMRGMFFSNFLSILIDRENDEENKTRIKTKSGVGVLDKHLFVVEKI